MITYGEQYTKIYVPYTISNGKWTYQDILEYDEVPENLDDIITQKFEDWVKYVENPIS